MTGPGLERRAAVDDALLLLLLGGEDAVRSASAGDGSQARLVLASVAAAADQGVANGQLDAASVGLWRTDMADALAARGVGSLDVGPWWAAAAAEAGSPTIREPASDGRADAQWWHGAGAVRVPMPCGTAGHVGLWERGELRVEGLDRESEEVLAALGGATCRCGETEAAWAAAGGDLGVLAVATRFDADPCVVSVAELADAEAPRLASVRAWERHRSRSGMEDPDEPVLAAWRARLRRLLLLTLPPHLQRRLVAGVAGRAAARWDGLSEQDRARLTAATAARAVPSLRSALSDAGLLDPSSPDPVVALDLAAQPGEPAVACERDGELLRVRLSVEPGWLASVWGRGLDRHGRGFCLAVTGVTGAGDVGGMWVRFAPATGNSRVETEVVQWENEGSPSGEPPTQE